MSHPHHLSAWLLLLGFISQAQAATPAAPDRAARPLSTASALRPTVDSANPHVQAQAQALAQQPALAPPDGHRARIDFTGRKQRGEVSIYARRFQGRHMADGHRFSHATNAAASKTLPIGTVAKVTNVQTGRTALVTIQDRGPYVRGRTVDVTRSTAAALGLTRHDGVAPVVVAPVSVPMPDGSVKVGAGAVPGPATVK